jgi:hypothetical protein
MTYQKLPKNESNRVWEGIPVEFLHKVFDLVEGDTIEVTLDHAANVQLLDQANYQSYRSQRPYNYHGGYVTKSPYFLAAPHAGHWHLVIDLGGNAGRVRASVRILSGADV